MSRTNRSEFNIFRNEEFMQGVGIDNEYNEGLNNKKGFFYCGMYVKGSTIDEFDKLLNEVGWMIL